MASLTSEPKGDAWAQLFDQAMRTYETLAGLPLKGDGRQKPDHNQRMEAVPRPELDAKLATIEAKMEGRLARIDDGLNAIRAQLVEQKNTAWKAAGATIGVFVAVFAIYVAAFDSGRETAMLAADAQRQVESTLQEMRQLVQDLRAAPTPQDLPASPPAPSPQK